MGEQEFNQELERRIAIIEEDAKNSQEKFSKNDWFVWIIVVVLSFVMVIAGAFIK